MEPCRVLFDVGFYGKEVFADELGSLVIFIRFGIQPSAGSSGRSRAEIQQDGARLLLCCGEGPIDILAPIHAHDSALCRYGARDSELKFERELKYARIGRVGQLTEIAGAQYISDGGRVRIGRTEARNREVHVVEQVEEFGTELKFHSLRDREEEWAMDVQSVVIEKK